MSPLIKCLDIISRWLLNAVSSVLGCQYKPFFLFNTYLKLFECYFAELASLAWTKNDKSLFASACIRLNCIRRQSSQTDAIEWWLGI